MCLVFTSGFSPDNNNGLLNESPLLVLSVHRLIRNNYCSLAGCGRRQTTRVTMIHNKKLKSLKFTKTAQPTVALVTSSR